MHSHPLELGAVFQPDWDERPIRVLAFDDREVMYDVWWPHKNAWGLANFRGTTTYYRIPTPFLLERGRYVRTDSYTTSEAQLHRPDLPLSFGRCAALNWSEDRPSTIAELAEQLITGGCANTRQTSKNLLAVPVVYLCPFGPKGGSKPGTLIHAKDGEAFTAAELLWHAWDLQAPHLREPLLTQGVGLYRSGVQRQKPSYYIWGARSMAEGAG